MTLGYRGNRTENACEVCGYDDLGCLTVSHDAEGLQVFDREQVGCGIAFMKSR